MTQLPATPAHAGTPADALPALATGDSAAESAATPARPPRPARSPQIEAPVAPAPAAQRTQLIRGRASVKRTDFHQDPVVGWLVVVGGPGLGAFRPVFEGNNTIGRAATQRIPLDFGDETISSEEQAYLRYDSVDRRFLLVPNLAKTNIIAVNERKPTTAVEIHGMDLITVGRTQLAFVPFCSADFDWSELGSLKG